MIYKIFSTKDSFISNISSSGNAGQNPILKIGKQTDENNNVYVWRSLLYFDHTSILGYQSSGTIPWNTASMEFRLRLFDCYFSGSYPSSFDVMIYPIASYSWDEGSGIEFDLSQTGTVNWNQPNSVYSWTITGADYYLNSGSASQHFDLGSEDLNVDATNIFTNYINGYIPNYGLIVLLSASQETSGSGNANYDSKMFYGRSTITNYAPYVELRYENFIHDDGNTEIVFNPLYSEYSNYFYIYNSVKGEMHDFAGVSSGADIDLIFTLYNNSASIIQSMTASWKERGIYEAGPISSSTTGNDGDIFTGSWTSQNGNFTIQQYFTITSSSEVYDRTSLINDRYVMVFKNLQQEYVYGSHDILNLFVRDRYPAYQFSSGNESLDNVILKNLCYEIRDAESNESIISYHPIYTRTSYGSEGNYFQLWTENLPRGKVYKIILINKENQSLQYYDRGWRFKIL